MSDALNITLLLAVKLTSWVSGSRVVAADCIPSNNMLWNPLRPLYNQLAGALGGLLLPVAIGVLLIAAFGGIIGAFRNQNMSGFIRIMMAVAGIVFGLIGAILILTSVYSGMNNLCS